MIDSMVSRIKYCFTYVYATFCTPVVLLPKDSVDNQETVMSFKECFWFLLCLSIPIYNIYFVLKVVLGTSPKVNKTYMNMVRASLLLFTLCMLCFTTYQMYALAKQVDNLNALINEEKTIISNETDINFSSTLHCLWVLREENSEYYSDGSLYFAIDNKILAQAYNQNQKKIKDMDDYIAKDKRIRVDQAKDDSGNTYTMVEVTISKEECKTLIDFVVPEPTDSTDDFDISDSTML